MFAEGSLPSVQRLLLVVALVSFGCQVDDRSLGFASSAGDLMDPEDGATSAGGSSGVAAPVGGSSGMAPTNVVGAAGSSGPVAGPGASNEQVVSPALAVPPGGACTPLGPPCSGSICIDAVCTLACDPLRP
ncbi:MAG TPA: hypothetical protein VJU61_15535, partial [Polyangiaceae bacterium]|nr:hypothetical protein [Polyangiaceae bacterium]